MIRDYLNCMSKSAKNITSVVVGCYNTLTYMGELLAVVVGNLGVAFVVGLAVIDVLNALPSDGH